MREVPEPRVAAWAVANAHQATTTVINRAEVLAGIELMQSGRRQDRMRSVAEASFTRFGAVLPMVDACARQFALIVTGRQRSGRRIEPLDALIAAICLEAGAILATRNIGDFEGIGLELINPWA